jgi:hypothetical protein
LNNCLHIIYAVTYQITTDNTPLIIIFRRIIIDELFPFFTMKNFWRISMTSDISTL